MKSKKIKNKIKIDYNKKKEKDHGDPEVSWEWYKEKNYRHSDAGDNGEE